MTQDIRNIVSEILGDILGCPSDNIDDSFCYSKSDMIDSFSLINFLMEIESRFDITFTANDYSDESFQTVSGLVNKIVKLQLENDKT